MPIQPELENLINHAGRIKVERTRLLDSELVNITHRIRQIGNKAIHENSTSRLEARNAITATIRVLADIYANIPKSQEHDA